MAATSATARRQFELCHRGRFERTILGALAFRPPATILLPMRRTKIICTLGPASEKPETLRQLVHEGTNVFRLNMSHAQHDWVREIVPRIRAISQELGRAVAILLDTQGPGTAAPKSMFAGLNFRLLSQQVPSRRHCDSRAPRII